MQHSYPWTIWVEALYPNGPFRRKIHIKVDTVDIAGTDPSLPAPSFFKFKFRCPTRLAPSQRVVHTQLHQGLHPHHSSSCASVDVKHSVLRLHTPTEHNSAVLNICLYRHVCTVIHAASGNGWVSHFSGIVGPTTAFCK